MFELPKSFVVLSTLSLVVLSACHVVVVWVKKIPPKIEGRIRCTEAAINLGKLDPEKNFFPKVVTRIPQGKSRVVLASPDCRGPS